VGTGRGAVRNGGRAAAFGGKTAYELTSAILREPPPSLPRAFPQGCVRWSSGPWRRGGAAVCAHWEVRSALEAIGSSEMLSRRQYPCRQQQKRGAESVQDSDV